jgi:hypothetical protein
MGWDKGRRSAEAIYYEILAAIGTGSAQNSFETTTTCIDDERRLRREPPQITATAAIMCPRGKIICVPTTNSTYRFAPVRLKRPRKRPWYNVPLTARSIDSWTENPTRALWANITRYNTIDNLELWKFKFRTTRAKVEVVFAPELASKSENNPLSYKEKSKRTWVRHTKHAVARLLRAARAPWKRMKYSEP